MERNFINSGKVTFSIEKTRDDFVIGTSLKTSSQSYSTPIKNIRGEEELIVKLIEEIACLFGLYNYKLIKPKNKAMISFVGDD